MSVIMFPIIHKPRFGDPCNRCGACCRQTPCVIANHLFGQMSGQCKALAEHSDGTTSCRVAEHPEKYVNVAAMRVLFAMNGPVNRKDLGADATPTEIILDALGDGSCDMVQRCTGGVDADIPMGADLDRIKAEREALWRK